MRKYYRGHRRQLQWAVYLCGNASRQASPRGEQETLASRTRLHSRVNSTWISRLECEKTSISALFSLDVLILCRIRSDFNPGVRYSIDSSSFTVSFVIRRNSNWILKYRTEGIPVMIRLWFHLGPLISSFPPSTNATQGVHTVVESVAAIVFPFLCHQFPVQAETSSSHTHSSFQKSFAQGSIAASFCSGRECLLSNFHLHILSALNLFSGLLLYSTPILFQNVKVVLYPTKRPILSHLDQYHEK
jgi:hypothetical protein